MPTLDTMQLVVLGSTVIDLVAALAIAWLLGRSRRDRDVVLAEQRAALETLKGDLAALLEDAERRARVLEASLRPGLAARDDPSAAAAPASTLGRMTAPVAAAARRLGIDAAEARLVRDLEVSLGRPRRA